MKKDFIIKILKGTFFSILIFLSTSFLNCNFSNHFKVRNYLVLFILFIYSFSFANMANPIFEGTLGSRPFVNQFVDIVHEDLSITIDENFETARFNVKYHFNSSKEGTKIPFLFYASEYVDSFRIKLDGKEVLIKDISYDFKVPENTKFNDFSYFFESPTFNDYSSVVIKDTNNSGFYITLKDMIYFETDIPKGNHTIEVNYIATKWIDTWDWVNEYSFRYALSPAKYWKSFGTIDIQIDAKKCKEKLYSNLGSPNKGDINKIAIWNLDTIPAEILQIHYNPEISLTAKTLIKVTPLGLALILGVLLIFLHLWFIKWHRKRQPTKRFSFILIIGILFIPFLFLVTWMFSYNFIDYFIGEHAGHTHGYTFFLLVLYPFILIVYGFISWKYDKVQKRNNLNKTI